MELLSKPRALARIARGRACDASHTSPSQPVAPPRSSVVARCNRCTQKAIATSSRALISPRRPGPPKATREEEAGESGAASSGARLEQPSGADASKAAADDQEDSERSLGVRAALAMLSFYRKGISPMMPKACRFLPTCSEYSIDAYKEYGVAKGSVLTAWRLMRCNPIGGKGYDPVQWPPPRLAWLFSADYSAEVAVVLAAALFAYLIESGAFNIL